ncbi:MAG: transcriptional repressor [Lachnospiraceae bacterium]
MIKYSRQREAIKNFLKMRKDHPTAETVYFYVKQDFPNISLGTVYRNLSLLTELGEIQKIPAADGGDRFDGNPVMHYHFFCKKCGCVMDLNLDPLKELDEAADKCFDGIIEGHTTEFYGICPECCRKQAMAKEQTDIITEMETISEEK